MRRQLGFTLIELMIVVVIVAILAAIAVPSYQQYVEKTRRADAKETLTRMAAAQERFFFQNNRYASTADITAIGGATSTEEYYDIARVNCAAPSDTCPVICTTATPTCYVLGATPVAGGAQAGDDACQGFYIAHTGARLAVDSNGDPSTDICWD